MKPIIEVNHVWKEFNKGIDRKYKSVRDSLSSFAGRVLKGNQDENFWALEDINFTVDRGESIGIIGRNGAGKSTFLKILARITPPTKGEIILRGRVASLLEVGTGFHQELTGRENIFFNGSILGMKHVEIKNKFDEIVDFSGIESFIDTPLKHFSSGMQLRLAFSVAAHLDAEILLIDEVLAVGDAEFQKKCIKKMDTVSKGKGKTILFVSHDMALVDQICTYSKLLNQGKIVSSGETNLIIKEYYKTFGKTSTELMNVNREGDGRIIVSKIELKNSAGHNNMVASGEEVYFDFYLKTSKEVKGKMQFAIGIDNQLSQRIAIINSEWKYEGFDYTSQHKIFRFNIKNFPLAQGTYFLTTYCTLNGVLTDWVKRAISFEVNSSDFYNVDRVVPGHQGSFHFDFEASLL